MAATKPQVQFRKMLRMILNGILLIFSIAITSIPVSALNNGIARLPSMFSSQSERRACSHTDHPHKGMGYNSTLKLIRSSLADTIMPTLKLGTHTRYVTPWWLMQLCSCIGLLAVPDRSRFGYQHCKAHEIARSPGKSGQSLYGAAYLILATPRMRGTPS